VISFRYHLVSIVAVFFALALGVLMGTAVLNQRVIDDLERRTQAAADRADNLRTELNRVEDLYRSVQDLLGQIEPATLQDKLTGREIVLVTGESADAAQVDGIRTALDRADASIVGVLVVESRMALPDEASRSELAGVLGEPDGSPEVLSEAAARAIGLRLADGTNGFEPDLLQELVASDFISVSDQAPEGLTGVGGADQSVVVLLGDDEQSTVDPMGFFIPLVEAVVSEDQPVAAGESADTVYPFVPLLREDGSLDGELVTVDNADTMPGRLAVVLGLRRLLETGQGGHFGVKDGAVGLIPSP
jgi:hypothetical protein